MFPVPTEFKEINFSYHLIGDLLQCRIGFEQHLFVC